MFVFNGSDEWTWEHNDDFSFIVGSLRRCIEKKMFSNYEGQYEKNKWLLNKVNFFHWRTLLKRIPTRQALVAKGMQIIDM